MRMKIFVGSCLLLASTLTLHSCGSTTKTDPNGLLSKEAQEDLKYATARYIHKLPNLATDQNKFEMRFDEYYKTKSKNTSLDKYYVGKGDTVYFEMSKVVPSLKLKKTATAGKLLKDSSGKIVYYEEVYRTWKMDEETLKKKSAVLFDLLIQNKDLSPYYNENSGKEEYIEFPDKNNTYDVAQRVWVQFQ